MDIQPQQANWKLWQEQQTQRAHLKRQALYVGACLLAILVAQNTLPFLFAPLMQRASLLTADNHFIGFLAYQLVYNVLYCLMLLLPTLLLSLAFRQRLRLSAGGERIGGSAFCLVVAGGMALCVLANYLVNIAMSFLLALGIQPTTGGTPEVYPGIGYLVINLVSTALLPALVEELVFRGYLMGALRPFGDRQAIVMSALLFGLLHGNMTQVPFAFMLGLVFGYLTAKTNNLLIPIVIHFLNNAMAVLLEQASLYFSAESLGLLQMMVFAAIAAAGGIALLILAGNGHPLTRPMAGLAAPLDPGQRKSILLSSPTIVIAIILMVLTILFGAILNV